MNAFTMTYENGKKFELFVADVNGDEFHDAVGIIAQCLGIADKGVTYLMTNGFTQSLTDAAAFTKEQKAKILVEAGYLGTHEITDKKGNKKTVPDALPTTLNEDELAVIADHSLAARESRFEDIQNGEVGTRTQGPRLNDYEKMVQLVTNELFRKAIAKSAKEKNKAIPKADSAKYAELKATWSNSPKNVATIAAEAKARIDRANALEMDDIELDL